MWTKIIEMGNLASQIGLQMNHAKSAMQNLVQNSQIVAQEQAYTVNIGCYFLLDLNWLLKNLLSWLLDARYYFLEAPGCLLFSKMEHRSPP